MMRYWVLAMATCLVLATITGCGAQPQVIESQMPSPLPPTETAAPTASPLPPTETAAPAATPLPPTATPTPTSAPEEAVTVMEDLLGSWQFPFEGDKYLIQFLEDGFWNLGWEGNLTAVDSGKYTVEGNILHFLTSPRGCPDAAEATYEAYVIRVDGKPVKLHLVLVGEDNCANRKQSLDNKTLPLFKH